jgi:hypothetical protein
VERGGGRGRKRKRDRRGGREKEFFIYNFPINAFFFNPLHTLFASSLSPACAASAQQRRESRSLGERVQRILKHRKRERVLFRERGGRGRKKEFCFEREEVEVEEKKKQLAPFFHTFD